MMVLKEGEVIMNLMNIGFIIKQEREHRGWTQKELAERLMVSEKTISKWETKRGLPDISLLEPLAKTLGMTILELFQGEVIINQNRHANALKMKLYVCPICGNVVTALGEGSYSCCGNQLLAQEAEVDSTISIEKMDNRWYVHLPHEMTKQSYISFIAYVTTNQLHLVKCYPEQEASAEFPILGHGIIYYYHNQNGLFMKRI